MIFLIAFCSQLEATSDVISGRFVRLSVPDKFLQFRDARLNCSPEIRPGAVGCGILTVYSNFYQSRLEVTGDVISDVAVGLAGIDARAKLGDCRLKTSETSFSAFFERR